MRKVKIYALIDPNDGMVKYVGKTEMSLNRRLYYHIYDLYKCTNIHKKNWFNKLLIKNQKPHIILIDEVDYIDWKFWEIYWISQFRSWDFKLVNYSLGGEGWTSNDVKNLWKQKEYREFHTNRVKGDKNPFYGKQHSNETKKILADKCPKFGSENGNYGKSQSDNKKNKIRINQPNIKTVIRLDINENYIDEWISIRFMCNELKLDNGAVTRVLKGKNTHHKGFKFKYK
jgi:hypothetical protein